MLLTRVDNYTIQVDPTSIVAIEEFCGATAIFYQLEYSDQYVFVKEDIDYISKLIE